jgi:hypothetical protein
MSKAPRRSLIALSPEERHAADKTPPLGKAGMSSAETAQYIAEFTAELSFLARQTKLDLLAYLLDMAKMEAVRSLQSEAKKR